MIVDYFEDLEVESVFEFDQVVENSVAAVVVADFVVSVVTVIDAVESIFDVARYVVDELQFEVVYNDVNYRKTLLLTYIQI